MMWLCSGYDVALRRLRGWVGECLNLSSNCLVLSNCQLLLTNYFETENNATLPTPPTLLKYLSR